MAKKWATMSASEQQELCQKLGLDLGKIDWKKIATLIQFILNLLNNSPTPMGASVGTALVDEHRKLKEALECCCDCCEKICEAEEKAVGGK